MLETIEAPAETRVVRWIATVHYRTDSGLVDVQHDMEELHELHDLIERGPHWDTIDHVHVVRSDRAFENLTVEGAERL
jgi:hypothetical protein